MTSCSSNFGGFGVQYATNMEPFIDAIAQLPGHSVSSSCALFSAPSITNRAWRVFMFLVVLGGYLNSHILRGMVGMGYNTSQHF